MLVIATAFIAISASISTALISSNANANDVVIVDGKAVKPNTFESLPADLLEDSNHPSAIQTEFGFFVKRANYDKNYNQNEIVYDSGKTTPKTKVIHQNGDIFIKVKDRN